MEIFLIGLTIFLLPLFVVYNELSKVKDRLDFAIKRIDSIDAQLVNIRQHADDSTIKFSGFVSETRRTLVALRESLDTTTPITPNRKNNWDSVREAFKGPVRVEINERN